MGLEPKFEELMIALANTRSKILSNFMIRDVDLVIYAKPEFWHQARVDMFLWANSIMQNDILANSSPFRFFGYDFIRAELNDDDPEWRIGVKSISRVYPDQELMIIENNSKRIV